MKTTTLLHQHAQDITTVRQRFEQQKGLHEAKLHAMKVESEREQQLIYEDRRIYR